MRPPMTNYPTAWQRRVLWTVITYLAIVGGGAVAVWLIYLFGQAVGFLQPVLIPFAIAAVLAFLLEPIVQMLTNRTRLSRTGAVLTLAGVVLLTLALAGVLIVPRIYDSTARMIQGMPAYTMKAQRRLTGLIDAAEARLAKFNHVAPPADPAAASASATDNHSVPAVASSPAVVTEETVATSAGPAASPAAKPAVQGGPVPGEGTKPEGNDQNAQPAPSSGSNPTPAASKDGQDGQDAKGDDPAKTASALFQPNGLHKYIEKQIPTLESKVPAVLDSLFHLLTRSLGAAGVLLDLLIVPVYLYFLLVESRHIARHWNEYLPIRDSPFKKEVVSVMLEINTYLVAFFRGQLIVSTIDGILIGGALALFVHLDFAFLIALLVIVLTFIPYLGIILCYIPVILIAIIQYGDFAHPLICVAIMFTVQTLESSIISPKIVGDSVGLHPVTVILSVFGWSLLLNGPIGAILAVPLSATVKVLLRRYVWEASGRGRHFVPLSTESMKALEDETHRAEEVSQGKRDVDGPRIAGDPVASAPPADKEAPAGPVFVPESSGKKPGEEA